MKYLWKNTQLSFRNQRLKTRYNGNGNTGFSTFIYKSEKLAIIKKELRNNVICASIDLVF